MERLHPNKRRSELTLAFLVAICQVGCNNQQMASTNPFMAPDRVPPPATRTIAPGMAAPYYPGDPMPGAQIVPPGQPPLVAQAQAVTPNPTPNVTAPAAAPPTNATPQPLAFSNERTVSIPTDDEQLRFAVPPPPSIENPMPQAIQPPAAPQVAANPMPGLASQVVPATYNQPASVQPAPFAVPTATTDADSSGPWRSPQVPLTGSPVMQAQYVQPQPPPSQPTILAAQPPQPQTPAMPKMPVELRSVPSPQVAPVEPAVAPPPRMRFPSITDPVSWFSTPSAPPASQQLIGYMVPGPNGAMQMVPLEQYQQMQAAGATQQPTSVATSDGFRPRGSAK